MTDRRDDQSYSVAPVRLGGSSSQGAGRSRRLSAILVLCACVGIALVAVVGPRLAERPNFDVAFFATPTPAPTPSPSATPFQIFGPTPLPAITRTGSTTLTGRVGVWTDMFRVLDLDSGLSTTGTSANLGSDAVVSSYDGVGWTCVCMVDIQSGTGIQTARTVVLVRIGPDGQDQGRTTLATYRGDVDENSGSGVQTDVVFADDHRSALLVTATRKARIWSFSAARIDIVNGSIGPAMPIDQKRMPDPPPTPSVGPGQTPNPVQTDVSGPMVRRSPDGRTAFVWATIQQYNQDVQLSVETFGWRLELAGDGSPSSVGPLPGITSIAPWCSASGFLRNDQFVSVCAFYPTDPNASDPPIWRWVELGRDGNVTSREVLPPTTQYYSDPLFDPANGAIWLWDPMGLSLVRASDHGRSVQTQHFDPLVAEAAGVGPIPGVTPTWTRAWSAVNSWVQTEITGAPDGSRLYLLGYAEQDGSRNGPPSLGVFVVDPTTLALVGRWAPDAAYISLQPLLGGSVIAAAGAPGSDADGNSAPWQASLTLHDATDGRILMRFGQLGDGWYPMIAPP